MPVTSFQVVLQIVQLLEGRRVPGLGKNLQLPIVICLDAEGLLYQMQPIMHLLLFLPYV